MPLNLIKDPWIPVRLKEGGTRLIRPDEITDPDILFPDWPRADLNIACLELLVGLVFMACRPKSPRDWSVNPPNRARLQKSLRPFAEAFDLDGDGPCFLQDLEPLDGKVNPPDMLFIDSAGANAARKNSDLMVRRGRYEALMAPLAAMALYTLQAMAPSGGSGNRTSMRGGGPLVTLVDPGGSLFDLVWANVPYPDPDKSSATAQDLPWMRPTRTSEKGRPQVFPQDCSELEPFFGMPRRLRLVWEGDEVTGVIQRPYGTNYAGFSHPLTPYYEIKGEYLPRHPGADAFGYQSWLGVTVQTGERSRPQTVVDWERRDKDNRGANLLVAGWAMSNMTPLRFHLSRQPMLPSGADHKALAGLIKAGVAVANALRGALRDVVGADATDGTRLTVSREAFFAETDAAFQALFARAAKREDVARDWLKALQKTALRIFDAEALQGLADGDLSRAEKVTDARGRLLWALYGGGRKVPAVFAELGLEPKDREDV